MHRYIVRQCYSRGMKWFKRNRSPYTAEHLVRLVTTNDERSMLLTTSPFRLFSSYGGSGSVSYQPVSKRRLAPIDPEDQQTVSTDPALPMRLGRNSTANNLRWPRPIIVPIHLVPRDFDDAEPSNFSEKFTQQSAGNFFPVVISDSEADRFNDELWSKLTYRARCHAWSIWQRHLKDWWFFIRYPLAFGAALGYAIATMVHLARSQP